ncbi:MAG: ATP-binding protein [Flavobacteriaceae bacterium]|nr:ATP-binding protein [Flavobacteriaceae bacterium]
MEEAFKQEQGDCLKIVLFGPESSGKTTLARELAEQFETHWVPEYMRTYLEANWEEDGLKITKKDLLPIAKGQIASENLLTKTANRFLFCDTNLLEIRVYSEYYYNGFCPPEIIEATESHIYDHYFLTQVDIPWEADNLRDRPYDREKLFRIFESELLKRNLPFTLLEGTKNERLSKATEVLATLKKQPNAN